MPGGSQKHPLYAEYVHDWEDLDNCYEGERVIKEKGMQYLPATGGQLADGATKGVETAGYINYLNYKSRAVFPDFVKDGVEAMLGVMHCKPPTIELPPKLEALRNSINVDGESVEQQLRNIHEAQLRNGRYGMLVDVTNGDEARPYIANYNARRIINWDDGSPGEPTAQKLNLVVLDESGPQRTNQFDWETKNRYRVLFLGDVVENESNGTYQVSVVEDQQEFNAEASTEPQISGRTLDDIPFVFVNAKDLRPDPSSPPLLGLARLALSVYKGEADYRQNLFMQGQDTLVIVGGTDEGAVRVGANATLQVPNGGDAKFIGVSAAGLSEQRRSLENDRLKAGMFAGRLADNRGTDRESGEAMRTRIGAVTATLNTIAHVGAMALETSLKQMAVWLGENPNAVKVTPNTDFSDGTTDGRTLVDMIQAKTAGLKLSDVSIHDFMRRRGLTNNDYEEELALLAEEEPSDDDDDNGVIVDDEGGET